MDTLPSRVLRIDHLWPAPCVGLVVASQFIAEAWRQQWEHVIQEHLASLIIGVNIFSMHINCKKALLSPTNTPGDRISQFIH